MRTPITLACRAAAALLLVLGAPLAGAQAGASAAEPASGLDNSLEQQVRALALSSTKTNASSASPTAPRIEVSVGQLDPRLRLAPCQHVEPYLPDGMRMWGKSRIGLRCTQGVAKWNVYLPITVRVFGTALVATSGVSAGSVLTAADLTQAEIRSEEHTSELQSP